MAKIRVGQLAKELNLQVGNVLARLRELGAEVKTNLSTVEEEVAGRLRASLKGSEKKSTDAPAKTAGARTPAGTGKTATATQVRTTSAFAPKPGAPSGTLATPPTAAHAGGPMRPAAPSVTRPMVPGGAARPPVTNPPIRPAAPKGQTTPVLARPAGAASTAIRPIQRSPLPAGQKPAPSPMRPLSGGAAQPKLQRPAT